MVKIYPTLNQKIAINRYIDTSRYVYNKTLEHINKEHKVNFQSLRDLLVTDKTRKGLEEYKKYDEMIKTVKSQRDKESNETEKQHLTDQIKLLQQQRRDEVKTLEYAKNDLVKPFELLTPKDIRACAVKRCCDAFKTGFSNLRNGNIRYFNMEFKKKKEVCQTIEVTPKLFSITGDGDFKLTPEFLKGDSILRVHKHSRKKVKKLKIDHNVDIVRNNNGYFVHLSVPINQSLSYKSHDTVAGIDLGIRTFATCHVNNLSTNDTKLVEYKHRTDLLKRYNYKINCLKAKKGRVKKKHFLKVEKKKKDLVDWLHWEFINHLLTLSDIVYLGDIKSHDIVNGGKNRFVNLAFNDLKFYQLKQRLLYKASVAGKIVKLVPEPYTTKTCSKCGEINNDVGSKEVFHCPCCNLNTGRDMNASKNIKMKGLFI